MSQDLSSGYDWVSCLLVLRLQVGKSFEGPEVFDLHNWEGLGKI